MERFEGDEMRTLATYKYFSTVANKITNTVKEVKIKPKKPKNLNSNPNIDFTADIASLDQSKILNRINTQQRSYEVPEQYKVTPKPQYIIGKVVRIDQILSNPEAYFDQTVWIAGWARTIREAEKKTICFIELNDGSQYKGIQVVVRNSIPGFEDILACQKDSSFKFLGKLIKSIGQGQSIEMIVEDADHQAKVIGPVKDAQYPMSKKYHTNEHLRKFAHLRPRSNFIGCVARIRNALSFATHIFFQTNGFLYVHTPIITASDCEGAGEMFQVTTIMHDDASKIPVVNKKTDYSKDFFQKPSFLTVSGQLSVENYACSLSNVYTFGPTFRAENSNTTRHLAEFWMIEPEMVFVDLADIMDCAENYVKFCLKYVLDNNKTDIEFLNERLQRERLEQQKEQQKNQKKEEKVSRYLIEDLSKYLQDIVAQPFGRCSYTDAIKLLEKAISEGHEFANPVFWGVDLATEHERYLAEVIFKRPVCVYNYPKDFKAFYMRRNEDGKTVGAMDLLAPGVGELIGGSEREERQDKLEDAIVEKGLKVDDYRYYIDLRRYGSVPHGGFGLGFERLIMMSTGADNIRDVIPFPRTPGVAEF